MFKPNSHNMEARISSKLHNRLQPNFAKQLRPPNFLRGWSKHMHNKSKMADVRHFESQKIAIFWQTFNQLSQNLAQ